MQSPWRTLARPSPFGAVLFANSVTALHEALVTRGKSEPSLKTLFPRTLCPNDYEHGVSLQPDRDCRLAFALVTPFHVDRDTGFYADDNYHFITVGTSAQDQVVEARLWWKFGTNPNCELMCWEAVQKSYDGSQRNWVVTEAIEECLNASLYLPRKPAMDNTENTEERFHISIKDLFSESNDFGFISKQVTSMLENNLPDLSRTILAPSTCRPSSVLFDEGY